MVGTAMTYIACIIGLHMHMRVAFLVSRIHIMRSTCTAKQILGAARLVALVAVPRVMAQMILSRCLRTAPARARPHLPCFIVVVSCVGRAHGLEKPVGDIGGPWHTRIHAPCVRERCSADLVTTSLNHCQRTACHGIGLGNVIITCT